MTPQVLALIASGIAGVASVTGAILGKKNQVHLQEIKVNVDGNLSRALSEIETLKTQTGDLRAQVAQLVTALGKSSPPKENS